MTDPDQIAADYDRALTERILDKPDTYFTFDPYYALAAKVGIHSAVLIRADSVRDETSVLIPGARLRQFIDWLTDVRDGCIEPATVGEERW